MKNKKANNNSNEKKEDDKLKKNDDFKLILIKLRQLVIYGNNILLWPRAKYITSILITQEE